MLRLGAHESIAGGLHRAFERGESVGCESLQIWVKSSRRWISPPLTAGEIAAFAEARARSAIHPVVAHAAYLINVASPQEALWQRSVAALVDEIERCDALDIPYLVLHPGAHTGSGPEAGIERIAEALREALGATSRSRVAVLVETTAGQGTQMGGDFVQLAQILERTDAGEARLGVCFDTCHVFTAGYELRTPEGYAATMAAFERSVGIRRIRALHLNDSRHALGSHRDRHAHIGEGHLGEESFRHILNDARLSGLPGILETPKDETLEEDRANLATLRALVADDVEQREEREP